MKTKQNKTKTNNPPKQQPPQNNNNNNNNLIIFAQDVFLWYPAQLNLPTRTSGNYTIEYTIYIIFHPVAFTYIHCTFI